MKNTFAILFPILFALLFGCNHEPKPYQTGSTANIGDTIQNDYAQAFRIIEFPESQRIEILAPTSGEIIAKYDIVKGSPEMVTAINPKEVQRIIALSSTHIGMLKKLKQAHKIVGISSETYLCDGTNNNAKTVGELGNADIESLIALNPDLLIYSGFNNDAPILKKLKTIGIKTFVNYDWQETHPLGRAEWIKVIGILTNNEAEAQKQYTTIKNRYLDLAKAVSEIASGPIVLAGTPYGDIFHAPAGESYLSQLISDAGGNYKYKNTQGTGSISLSFEALIAENKTTDIWLNAAARDKAGVRALHTSFELLQAFEQNMYSYYANVNCFWENSAIMPDIILEELINLFHPGFLSKKAEFQYYQRLE